MNFIRVTPDTSQPVMSGPEAIEIQLWNISSVDVRAEVVVHADVSGGVVIAEQLSNICWNVVALETSHPDTFGGLVMFVLFLKQFRKDVTFDVSNPETSGGATKPVQPVRDEVRSVIEFVTVQFVKLVIARQDANVAYPFVTPVRSTLSTDASWEQPNHINWASVMPSVGASTW